MLVLESILLLNKKVLHYWGNKNVKQKVLSDNTIWFVSVLFFTLCDIEEQNLNLIYLSLQCLYIGKKKVGSYGYSIIFNIYTNFFIVQQDFKNKVKILRLAL